MESSINGKAFIVENSGNAKLEIQFFWPFKGKYWIIELGQDYSYAVVGHPKEIFMDIVENSSNARNSFSKHIE